MAPAKHRKDAEAAARVAACASGEVEEAVAAAGAKKNCGGCGGCGSFGCEEVPKQKKETKAAAKKALAATKNAEKQATLAEAADKKTSEQNKYKNWWSTRSKSGAPEVSSMRPSLFNQDLSDDLDKAIFCESCEEDTAADTGDGDIDGLELTSAELSFLGLGHPKPEDAAPFAPEVEAVAESPSPSPKGGGQATSTAASSGGATWVQNARAPSLEPQLCSLCNCRLCVENRKCSSKGAVSYKCPECNTRCTQLNRIFGSFPPKSFKTLPAEFQTQFWQDLHKVDGPASIENFVVKELSRKRSEIEESSIGGEYLPLSVYKKRGYDRDMIEKNCQNVLNDPVVGKVYKLDIRAGYSKTVEAMVKSELYRQKHSENSSGGQRNARSASTTHDKRRSHSRSKSRRRRRDRSTSRRRSRSKSRRRRDRSSSRRRRASRSKSRRDRSRSRSRSRSGGRRDRERNRERRREKSRDKSRDRKSRDKSRDRNKDDKDDERKKKKVHFPLD